MKILVLSHMYPRPDREHYGVFVHEPARELAARGHSVRVVAPVPRTPPGLAALHPAWRRLARLPARRELDGIPVAHPRYLLLPRRLGFAAAAGRMARAVLALPDLADVDLIHAHAGLPDGAAARRVAARLGVSYLVTSHGSDVLRAALWSRAAHGELHDAFRGAARVLMVSRAALARAEARALPVDRAEVLWNGYRDDLFLAPARGDDGGPPCGGAPTGESAPDAAGRVPRLICVANLVPSKNVDALLDALGRLREAGLSLPLRVVGTGPEAPALARQAAALALDVTWTPRLDRPALAAALREADVFVLPARGESFGIAYLEAMASGLPVVAPAGEGIGDLVADGAQGLLTDPGAPGSLDRALRRLAEDGDLRRRLGAAARERARGLGWTRHAERLEAVYETALAESRGGAAGAGGAGASEPAVAARGAVLHLLYNSEPDRNGYAMRSRYILRAQRALGRAVQAATSPFQQERWSPGPRETREGILYHRLALRVVDRRRGRLGWRRFGVFVSKALADRLLAPQLARVLRAERPAILHAHSPAFVLFLARRAARRAGQAALPLVYEARGLTEETEALVGNTRAGGILYGIKRRLEERAMGAADAVVTISEGMRADFARRGVPAGKIHVVPNGVDCEAIQPPARDAALAAALGLAEGRTLGYIGSLGRLEGLPWLVERLAELPDDWRLVIVGDGQDRPVLLARAGALGLTGRVTAPGSVPHAAVGRWYGIIDYFVLPRPSLRVTELVTPLKPLEAMAAERVVLASDVGGHREIIDDGANGLLFRRGDPRAFVARVTELAAQPARRRELGAAARRWARAERDWTRLAERYEAVYADAAASAARRGGKGATR
ncbi:MAG: glycosyltransferase [Candidatus Krumholzibacteriota bacterium]|nr:glycosyltransferase [Candidatus Krumholzibacteriota bacterium]